MLFRSGESGNGQWKFMRIKFQGVEGGFFSDSTFSLDDKATERKPNAYGGVMPSAYDRFMMKIKHLLDAVAPDVLTGLSDGTIEFKSKSGDQFKQYVEFISGLLAPYAEKKVQTKIKLVMYFKLCCGHNISVISLLCVA